MDLIQQLGELALGSRLRRLSDQIMQSGEGIYELYGIDFNPVWFPVYYALSQNEKMGVMQMAETLDFSHPYIIKIAKALKKKGYVHSFKEETDLRKNWWSLTEEGRSILPKMQQAWKDIANAANDTLNELSQNLLIAVSELETAYTIEGLPSRVRRIRNERLLQKIEIIDYSFELKDHFKRLNYQWIEKLFKIEEADRNTLEYPEENIIHKGGDIVYAKVESEIVGTCGLKKYSDEKYELIKMAVDKNYRGLQIGKKLGLAIIAKAKALGCKTLFLESNKSLTPAINLYYRLGFKEVPLSSSVSDYERADIRMEIKF